MPSDARPLPDTNSKKRKRGTNEDSSSKLQSASVNLERLMESLDGVEDRSKGKQKKRKRKDTEKVVGKGGNKEEGKRQTPVQKSAQESPSPSSKLKAVLKGRNLKTADDSIRVSDAQESSIRPKAPKQTHPEQQEPSNRKKKRSKTEVGRVDVSPEATAKSLHGGDAVCPLTNLQSRMKQSLDGARFRQVQWISSDLHLSVHKRPFLLILFNNQMDQRNAL